MLSNTHQSPVDDSKANLDKSNLKPKPSSPLSKLNISNFKKLSLRTKASLLAIALSSIPVLVISSVAYVITNKTLTDNISNTEQSDTIGLADKANRFIFERYGDIQALSNLPSLTTPAVQKVLSPQEKSQILTNYLKFYDVYDSIGAFDRNGNVIAQSTGNPLENQRDRR